MSEQQNRNSLQYFANQVGEFWTLMGDKTAWENDGDKILRAKGAIAKQYLALKLPPDEMITAATYLQSAINQMIRKPHLLGIDIL